MKDEPKYRLCFRRALDARQAAHHVIQLADSEPVVGAATGQSQRPHHGVHHPTAEGGGQQLGDHQACGETMSKESLSVKDFSWKQQLGDH
jgi:hypothetical protein